ncbi:DUF6264 family protein [Agromyces bauzanensis]
MSQPHAPGTPEESARPAGADGVPGASPTPADASSTPRDERPRPQYGEYAPEGWTWQPPAGERTSDPAPQMATPPPAAPAPWRPAPAPGAPRAASGITPAPSWDRIATIALLVFGAVGAWSTASSMQQLAQQIQLSYDMLAIGQYTPPPWLPTISLVGTIVQLALYAAVVWLSLVRLRARRLAFWIPLAGGAVSFLITVVILAIVMLNDPTYMSFLESGIAPTATPTP